MPLFYLHIRSGAALLLDEEGCDFADLAAARHEAIRGARSLMSADILEGELQLDQSIEIQDADGRSLSSVQFGDALDIVPTQYRLSGSAG